MAIRFKFRSSIQFDSVEIDNRPSITVRDLRFKILRHKNLNSCHDFDLVFSDAVTGEEYVDENFQIPSGSSVIIKRVPAGLVHSAIGAYNGLSENLKVKNTKVIDNNEPPEIDDFGELGAEWCPVTVPEVTSFDYKPHPEKMDCTSGDDTSTDTILRPRNLAEPLLRCQLLPANDVSEACPKYPVVESRHNTEEHLNPDKRVVVTDHPSTRIPDLPSELRCSICNTYFKEAVMIPCCQHSFCKRCIHSVLVDQARCPKCSSTKCKVEDLLPNVCLSKAIDRFLVSQILPSCSDVILGDAPDGESGIQACFHGTDSCSDHFGASKYMKLANLNDEEGGGSTLHVDVKEDPRADFQGENQPINISQTPASTSKRKRESSLSFAGGDRNLFENGRYEKGDRTCYMCGSPDHFIRDCPAASNPHHMPASRNTIFPGVMPGTYASPYYAGPPSPHFRPLVHPYYSPGMMSCNGAMVPCSPFSLSPHMASMYGGTSFFGGYMNTGHLAPPSAMNVGRPISHYAVDAFQESQQTRKHLNEFMDSKTDFCHSRKQSCDNEDSGLNTSRDHNHNEMGRPHYHKYYRETDKILSCSEDSFSQKSQRGNQRCKDYKNDFLSAHKSHRRNSRSISGGDRGSYHLERSSSIVEDRSNASNGHTEDSRHSHEHRGYKRHTARTRQCSSDSSRNLSKIPGERSVKKHEVDFNDKRRGEKHGNLFKSAIVAVVSNDIKELREVKESRPKETGKTKGSIHDRWQMIGGSDDEYREEDHLCKRKKV